MNSITNNFFKFIARLFGFNRYQVFIRIDKYYVKEIPACSFILFKRACIVCDNMQKNAPFTNSTYFVATDKYGIQLHPYNKEKTRNKSYI